MVTTPPGAGRAGHRADTSRGLRPKPERRRRQGDDEGGTTSIIIEFAGGRVSL